MGKPGNRNVSRTQDTNVSFFGDDLKQYQERHKVVHEIIVQADYDTGACYAVPKCAETEFKH